MGRDDVGPYLILAFVVYLIFSILPEGSIRAVPFLFWPIFIIAVIIKNRKK